VRCDIHGGGVRSYAREYDQDEWPRAAAAIDLSTVRPVAVMTPTVLGLNDVYGAVRSAGFPFEDAIPIARAIPVNAADVQEASHAVAKTSEAAHPTDVRPSAEPEIRKAEAVRPLDSRWMLEHPGAGARPITLRTVAVSASEPMRLKDRTSRTACSLSQHPGRR
jgi:hypothetical protein